MNRRRALLAAIGYKQTESSIPNNEIWYTASDGNIVEPCDSSAFDANIVSNTYNDGKGVIKFDSDVITIGEAAFNSCYSLTSITIPDSVTYIGINTFTSCSSLTSVTIPYGVTEIDEGAFAYCESLTSVTIGNSVTTIGESAFAYCESLTSVTIGNSVTTIGNYAFDNCTSLKEFTGKFATEDGRSLIMDNTIIAYANASGATYTIPDSVTTIKGWVFAYCESLTSVNIPDSVTEIEWYAFSYCDSLTSVNIPDSVTTIGNSVFYKCTSLTSITIPNSVTSIGGNAFQSCNSLTSVYCKAVTPPELGNSSAFNYNGSGRKIYVPTSSVNAYKSATNWSEYASAIVGYNF